MSILLPSIGGTQIKDALGRFPEFEGKEFSVIELPHSSGQVFARKRFYRMKTKSGDLIFLICGVGISDLYTLSKEAYKVYPKITCEPLFFYKCNKFEIFGQTFFDGEPIDQLFSNDVLSQESVSNILNELDSTFLASVEESTPQELIKELQDFFDRLCKNQILTEIDRNILDNVCRPFLERNTKFLPVRKRLSNGDLAARNILVNRESEFKVIDFEFGSYSHFADEDWFRLWRYSNDQFKNISFFENSINSNKEFYEPYFWLKQFSLDAIVHPGTEQQDFSKVNLSNAFLSSFPSTDSSVPLLLQGLSDSYHRVERKHYIEFQNKLHFQGANFQASSKIDRMVNSFSWKSTGFLRLLRRKFIDPRTKVEHRKRLKKKTSKKGIGYNYKKWVQEKDFLSKKIIKKLLEEEKKLVNKPKLSIILPVFDPPEKVFKETIQSVLSQIYCCWELCIINDASQKSYIKPYLDHLAKTHNQIKVKHRESNGHISIATNDAVAIAEGEYLVFLDHDDLLRQHSLLRFAQEIVRNPQFGIIYSDEDKVDGKGQRYDHHFKPDWNPDLFLSQNYLCHLVCCKKAIFDQVGGMRPGVEGCQDWDLLLRMTEVLKFQNIGHISEILYHWRSGVDSTALSLKEKPYVLSTVVKVLNDALHRRGVNALAELGNRKNGYMRIKYSLPEKLPLVSIIIPTKDRFDLLSRCVETLLDLTDYNNFEILILDHNSNEQKLLDYFTKINKVAQIRILKMAGEFNFSRINNLGVKQAKGEILLFLNNDIEITNSSWLSEMVSQVLRTEIGCVGAKLLYPNDTVQHGGVIIGLGGVAGHSHKHFHKNHPGYKHRLQLVQNFSAVTAACLAVRKKIFDEVGGFNENDLKVAFNDVDLCLKVVEKGYRNLWTPHAVLIHHESASRGKDTVPEKIERFKKEISYMKKRWKHRLEDDPSFNKNFNKDREDFSLVVRR